MDNKKKIDSKLTDEDLAQVNGGALFETEIAEENPLPKVSYKYEVIK